MWALLVSTIHLIVLDLVAMSVFGLKLDMVVIMKALLLLYHHIEL